jgi:hypothetical protein
VRARSNRFALEKMKRETTNIRNKCTDWIPRVSLRASGAGDIQFDFHGLIVFIYWFFALTIFPHWINSLAVSSLFDHENDFFLFFNKDHQAKNFLAEAGWLVLKRPKWLRVYLNSGVSYLFIWFVFIPAFGLCCIYLACLSLVPNLKFFIRSLLSSRMISTTKH